MQHNQWKLIEDKLPNRKSHWVEKWFQEFCLYKYTTSKYKYIQVWVRNIRIGPRPVFFSKEMRSFILFTTSDICNQNQKGWVLFHKEKNPVPLTLRIAPQMLEDPTRTGGSTGNRTTWWQVRTKGLVEQDLQAANIELWKAKIIDHRGIELNSQLSCSRHEPAALPNIY